MIAILRAGVLNQIARSRNAKPINAHSKASIKFAVTKKELSLMNTRFLRSGRVSLSYPMRLPSSSAGETPAATGIGRRP